MNHVKNDLGQFVIAVGAPGSVERIKIQYPHLIKELNNIYSVAYECYGRGIDEALELIHSKGIVSKLETKSLLQASMYSMEKEGTVTSLVLSCLE